MASRDVRFVEETLRSWRDGVGSKPASGEEIRDGDEDDVASEGTRFVPTDEQRAKAAHLANRLDLARCVAGGMKQRVANLARELETQAREHSSAREDLRVARRRLHFARNDGRSALAALPIGADAGAAPSVHDSEGRALGAMLTKAARDPDATKALAERLALRKTLVTDELLALSALDADARRRQTQV